MSIETLKNGTAHDSYAVDAIFSALRWTQKRISSPVVLGDLLERTKEGSRFALFNSEYAERFIKAGLIDEAQKLTPIGKDVVLSTVTEGDRGATLLSSPYLNERSLAQRAGAYGHLADILHSLESMQNQGDGRVK